jgi:hypothetical protein
MASGVQGKIDFMVPGGGSSLAGKGDASAAAIPDGTSSELGFINRILTPILGGLHLKVSDGLTCDTDYSGMRSVVLLRPLMERRPNTRRGCTSMVKM